MRNTFYFFKQLTSLCILCFILSACGKDGEQKFNEQLRKALGVPPVQNGSQVQNSSLKQRGKLITPSEQDLLSQKNSIKGCPQDSLLIGHAFPHGRSQWCAYKDSKKIEVKHGEFRSWHNNGKLKSQCIYADGEIHGVYKEWYDDGVVKESTTYSKGRKQGKSTIFSKEGKKIEEADYADDLKNGLYVKYNKTAQPIIKGVFKNDQKHGVWEFYDSRGALKEKSEFQFDIKHGRSIKYGLNNVPLAQGYFDKGIEVGHWIYYDTNGAKKTEGNFIAGKKSGKWVDYNQEGEMNRIHYFNNGRRTDSIKVQSYNGKNQGFGNGDILGAEPPIRKKSPSVQKSDQENSFNKPSPLKKDEGWSSL